MKKIHYSSIHGYSTGSLMLLAILGFFILLGFISFVTMEHEGHHITGMTNQVIWGLPHVFAIFLIVAASGALNVASIASVFNQKMYKPLSRLSGVLALALLAGGLVILVLDLGRPDRLIVAMTYYNFKSIFAWNIILYNGFFLIVGIYLWTMLDWKVEKFSRIAGTTAFIWRLILTTGTGSIFGFLVARQAYDAAIMAPMFIIMSFSFGLAIYLLVLMASFKWTQRELGDVVIKRLKNLLGVFVAATLYFSLAYHLTNLYATEHHGIQSYILLHGGVYTLMFWVGQVLIGSIIPLLLLYWPNIGSNPFRAVAASALVILGGLAMLYVIVIGGQTYPMTLVPGYEATSSFLDGEIVSYTPSIWELMLGMGGVALALTIVFAALKLFRLLPVSLSDEVATGLK
ncbi:MAG: polysulfide reductase NrfD [Gammaproteobacteria bacterium]|nr:polysulfide reductase NrfD [Gammaproteobacteria bacterium]